MKNWFLAIGMFILIALITSGLLIALYKLPEYIVGIFFLIMVAVACIWGIKKSLDSENQR